MADEDTERLKIMQKIVRRSLTKQQDVLQYVQIALGREWPSFFFL